MKKLINLSGLASPHLSRKLTYLLLLLVTLIGGSNSAWADTTLFSTNFSTTDGWSASTDMSGSGSIVIKGTTISYKAGGSVAATSESGTLTFGNASNLTDKTSVSQQNYYIAIPLSGVNGSITITYTGTKTGHYFTYDDGNTGTLANRAQGGNNDTRSWTISGLTSSNVTLYVGTKEKQVNSLIITTPSGGSPSPVDPTITFNNGAYTIGGSALNLSTLFTSNSSGAVTYTVKNANGTGATVAGTSFTATTAGTATVTATQAAVAGTYNAKAVDATITVNAAAPSGLVPFSIGDVFIADDMTENGTKTNIAKNNYYYDNKIYTTGSGNTNSVAANKGSNSFNGGSHLKSLRVKDTQDAFKFSVSEPCTVTFYTESQSSRGLNLGTANGGTDLGVQPSSTAEWSVNLASAGDVYVSSYGGDFYIAGFTVTATPITGTIFSLTNPTAPTSVDSKQEVDLVATIEGGSAKIFNNRSEAATMVQSNQVKLGGSGDSYLLLNLDKALEDGDKITIEDGGTWKISTTKSGTRYDITTPKTINNVDDSQNLIGATSLYIFKNSTLANISSVKITRGDAPTYTITYNPGANGTGSIAAGEKEQGVAFTLSSSKFTRDGYTQTGWATTDGGAKAYELGGSYTTDADITLYPVWTVDSRPLLIFHANGGVGDDYTQPFTPNNNTGFRFLANQFTASSDAYEFAGWALTSDGPVRWKDQDNPKVPYETNVDLYAVWILKAGYTVSYDMKGHGASIPSVTNQKKMTYLNMPQLGIVDGYYFDGWYTDAGLSSAAAWGTTLIANTTLYAKWTQFTDYTYTTVAVTDNATTNGTNLKNAINAANGQAATVRKVIYVPNGTYDFGDVVGPTINQHNITIVGESKDGVIIKNNISTNNSSTSATIAVGDVKNVYLENLTIQNAFDYVNRSGSDGIACAFYDKGTNTIIKNLKLLSYQDTYTTAKGDKMRYVLDCEIHGIVDFICGEGKTLFDRCTLVAESDNGSENHGSATLTASQSSSEYFDDYGFVFKDCTVESHVNSISLGRAWNNQSMTAFINTTFTGTGSIISDRWTTLGMAAGKSAYKFYEYGSTGTVGNAATPASKVLSFKDNTGKVINANFETVLPASEAALYTMTNIYPYWIAYNYYTITKDEPANGAVNVYPTYVAAGDKVKAFAEPAGGYVKEAWNVYRTGNEASKVAVDGSDMFVMPAYNTTVSATFTDDGTVGTSDLEKGYLGDYSQPISIAAGKTRHITFNVRGASDSNFRGAYLVATSTNTPSNIEETLKQDAYMILRPDRWDNMGDANSTRKMLIGSDDMVNDDTKWTAFRTDQSDAQGLNVDMYVSYSGNRFYVYQTMAGKTNTYTYTAETVEKTAAASAYLFLTVDNSYITNIHVDDETDANAVSASYGTNGASATMTNSIGMNVTNGTCVQTGEQIEFSATPADGYKFSNWTTGMGEGTTVVTTANPYQATITAPIALTANFVSNATVVVAAPVIDASDPSAVTITAEGGAKIYYTTNGTNAPSHGIEYTGPFALTESTPIRAVASTDNAQTFSAETIANVNVNTDANVKLLGSASLSSATLKPYEWNITEGANAGTYSLSCDDSGRKRALWSLFETDDAYKVSANYQYHLTTPLGFKVTKIAIIGRSNSSSNDANITLDGQNLGKLMQSSPEVIKTLTYEVTNPEYGKVFTIQSDKEMLINIELWGTMTSTVYTAEATSAQPGMGSASVSEAIVASGEDVTFYAQAEDGYTFVNWTDASGNVVSTDAEYTTKASANLSLIANFRVAGSEDATLTSLSYNGINIPLVEDQYVYDVRALSTVMPNVVAVANDANATINYTQATDYNGTATIEVVAEAGNVETYTVNFTESQSVPAGTITWTLNGGTKTAFTGEVTAATADSEGNLYGLFFNGNGDISRDWYGSSLYYIAGTGANGRYIKLTGISGSGKITINTTGVTGATESATYYISETMGGGTQLATASIDGTKAGAYESSAYTYDPSKVYYINIGTRVNITSIVWTPYEIQDGKDVTLAVVNGGRATISGDKITYVVPYGGQNASTTIPVTLTLSNRASATATSPFPAEITSGTEFNVELGVASGTKVNSTVTVRAENGETQTYSVQILRGSMATSGVLYVETDGQQCYLTKEEIGNAKYASISYDGTGTNNFDGNNGTYYDIKNSKKYIQITETGAKFYNVYVQHNNSTAARKLDLYVDDVKVKTIEVGPKVLNESGILPILADGTDDGQNHVIKLVGAGSDVYPVKIKFYTTKQAASLTPAAIAIKMGKVTEDIAVTATSGAVVSYDETASSTASEYVTVSYSNGSLTLTPKKAGTATLYFDIAAAGAFNAKDNAEIHVTISKQDLTLTYTPSSYECNLDDEESTRPTWVQPTLVAKDEDGKTVTGLTYTYFSDDESIATVADDGTITRKVSTAVGSAGIYATFEGNETYNDAQAVFTVKYVQGFTYQITDKTKFAGDKTNPAIREQIVLKDKENHPLVYATFGGWKRNSNTYHRPGASADRTDKWSKPVRYTGTQGNKPLYVDGFEFAASGADNACEETMDQTLDPSHEDYANSGGYFRIPDAGGKYPFTLPVRGAYMTFEPTKNGKLTVYILQNGAFNSSVDADGNSVVIPGQFRKHSFYVADQEGNIYYEGSSYGSLTYISKQNVSNYYQNTYPQNGTEWHLSADGTQILDASDAKVYDADINSKDVAKWPEFYQNYTANERKRISINWEDEATGHGERQMVTVLDDGSHFLAMKAYAKYSIDVLGGQTYYIFSNRSKLGFCGMNFVPDEVAENAPTAELTLNDNAAYVAPTLTAKGTGDVINATTNSVAQHGNVSVPQYKTITLNRTFTADNWESICLPFTMTEKEVEDNFGVGTELIIMNSAYVEGTTLNLGFVYHEIQSILAGYPYLIKPTTTTSAVTVSNKIIDRDAPQMTFTGTDYVFKGIPGYSTANVTSPSGKTGYSVRTKEGDVFLSGNTLYISQGTSVVKGYRAYIDFTGGIPRAKAVSLSFGNRWDEDNDTPTSIESVMAEDIVEALGLGSASGVYNLNGQKIAKTAKGLPAGIYIINGNKTVIK